MSPMYDAARDYVARGFSILPMKMETKRPAVRWKRYQSQRVDESRVQLWFGNGTRHGIGVIFGPVSGGLASRDFDNIDDYERWADEHRDLAESLPTVETRRGRHVYFLAAPEDVQAYRKAIGKPTGTGAINLGDGELRAGHGCYSVLPPSVHPEGHLYRWLIELSELRRVDFFSSGLAPCNIEGVETQEDLEDLRDLKTVMGCGGGESNELTNEPPSPTLSCLQFSMDSLPSLLQERIELAIRRTLPTGPYQRHKRIFEFARELKAIPEFANASAKSFKPLVRMWYERGKPYVNSGWDETWFDFTEGWPKVLYAKGTEPLTMAFLQAAQAELPKAALEYESPKVRLLVAACRELQRTAGSKAFFLTARAAGRHLDIDHTLAWRWLRGLCNDGVLKLIASGSLEKHKANYYRYLADD